MTKDELDVANESADQKNKKIITDIIDPTPDLFIDEKLNPNEQNLQNTTDNLFNLPPQVQQELNETVFKKIIKQTIIQPTPPEIIPNVLPKTKDFFINDDKFDLFKKPGPVTINIGQPKDENYEAKIWKSLIKTDIEIKNKNNLKWKKNKTRKPYKKLIAKQNLQDALDFAFNDLETVDYNNDTRLDNLDDLETVDYNNDTSITDLVPIKKLETIKEEDDEEDGLQIIKLVHYATISDYNDDVKFIKKTPLHPRERLKHLSKNNLIRNQTDEKNNFPQILPQKKANVNK